MAKISVGIADDNKDFCEILTDYFKDQDNMEVVFVANDGIQTIDGVKKHMPDVLILDMIIPHLDGLGVLENINNLELDKYPKAVMLSAVGQESITQKAIKLGAEYYLVKPFNLEV